MEVMDLKSPRRRLLAIGTAIVVAIGVITYVVVRAQQGDGGLVLYGNVDIREVNLGFRVAGRVASLAVDEGDVVHAGQALGQLDVAPLERELHEAEGALASLKARHALLTAGYRPEEVAQARATLAERRAALLNAEQELARQSELRGTGATSQRGYDEARAARDEARARVTAAEQSLKQLAAGFRKEEVAESGANMLRAEASVAQSQLRLEDTTLKAPADGVILTRAVEPGAILASGATVFTLSLSRPVWVRAYVGEPDLGRAAPGAAVELYTDSRPGKPYHGRIGYVSPNAEFTPKNVETADLRTSLVYRLRIVVADPDAGLRQGMPVTVKLAPAGRGA
jgi:HlyD family secretion protein